METFAKRLKGLRKEKKRTQAQMADYLQCSLRAYQYYEEGKHIPDLYGLLALADILEVSLDYLTGRSERQEREGL